MVDGNKPKQQRVKPVDKQANLNLNEELKTPALIPQQEQLQSIAPDYRSQAFFTRKQIPRAKRKKLRKIARKSRQINRRLAKQ